MSNVIDIDKVNACFDKTKANPDLFAGVSVEFKKYFGNLGIDLNLEEKRMLLQKLISQAEDSANKGNFLCIIIC